MELISTYSLQIKESHLDTFGHVNNARYLEIYEEARWSLIDTRGLGLEKILEEKIGPVLLEANLKFRRELKNKDKISVQTFFDGMPRDKFFKIHQKMINEENDVASTLDLLIAVMDLKERKIILPPHKWREALTRA